MQLTDWFPTCMDLLWRDCQCRGWKVQCGQQTERNWTKSANDTAVCLHTQTEPILILKSNTEKNAELKGAVMVVKQSVQKLQTATEISWMCLSPSFSHCTTQRVITISNYDTSPHSTTQQRKNAQNDVKMYQCLSSILPCSSSFVQQRGHDTE